MPTEKVVALCFQCFALGFSLATLIGVHLNGKLLGAATAQMMEASREASRAKRGGGNG